MSYIIGWLFGFLPGMGLSNICLTNFINDPFSPYLGLRPLKKPLTRIATYYPSPRTSSNNFLKTEILQEKTYKTRDLSEAALLYSSGIKLLNLENDNGRYWFIFDDKDSCQDLANAYWQKAATVNAKEFADSMRTLKALLFNQPSN